MSENTSKGPKQRHPAMVLAIVSLVLIVLLAFASRNWMVKTREDIGLKLQEVSTSQKADHEQLSSLTDKQQDLAARFAVMESKQKEAAAQQQSLEALYQNLLKSRDETALTEVDQLLTLASQQLILLGNVEGALIALNQAQMRLGKGDRPLFTPVKKAIAKDIERLKALPKVDLVVLAQRLDSVLRSIEHMALISEPSSTEPAPVGPANESSEQAQGVQAVLNWTRTLLKAAWRDVTRLVRVREVVKPDAMLIAPEQAYFLRQNLRLRLLNARLALLSRQQTMLRDDLNFATEWLKNYFDPSDPDVSAALSITKDLSSAQLTAELPNLAESISALRLARSPTAAPLPSAASAMQ